MCFAFRRGAILSAMLLALAATGGFVAAGQVVDPGMPTVATAPAVSDTEITGSIDRAAVMQVLPLSDEQRGLIFLGVMNLPDVPDADMGAQELTVLEGPQNPAAPAAAMPETIALQDLPAMVVRGVPLLRDHKFVKLYDRILIVRPVDRVVVSQIPRYRLLP